ncbi:DsrE family protein [Thiohalorhabdus sp. Cl-TMA]|uniref:DsrE family protein n=1 Tax=Thiohalorhabdus methylotrophus TaxID=3242694 RepID=A0ABV4TTX8_9GAMM
MRTLFVAVALLLAGSLSGTGYAVAGQRVQTPYEAQKVVYDFYFDTPEKIGTALYWLRAHLQPLERAPYGIPSDFMDIKVVIHGTEIVTMARKNYDRYRESVERMRYYDQMGVSFKVCGLAARDYDYRPEDFYDFVDVVPSAQAELAHWQSRGYALIIPQVHERRQSIEEIR